MAPIEYCGVFECAVRTSERHASILHLEDTTRSKGFESTGEDGGDVFEAIHECAAVNIIEWLPEHPLILRIVNLKLAVRGNAKQLIRKV